jgi:hypothetical protein
MEDLMSRINELTAFECRSPKSHSSQQVPALEEVAAVEEAKAIALVQRLQMC